MKHIEEIREKNIKTVSDESLNEVDLLYIDKLFEALVDMQGKYLKKQDPLTKMIRETKERNYSSQIRVQLNEKLKEDYPKNNPLGLYCESEDSKTFYIKAFDKLHGKEKEPDIYIHSGEDPVKGIQELICEVKRLSRLTPENMMGDLNKLISYSCREIWEGHGFKIAVFIVNNGSEMKLKEKVNGFMNNYYPVENLLSEGSANMSFQSFVNHHQERLKNILCFCHSEEGIVELSTVYEIVKSKIMP